MPQEQQNIRRWLVRLTGPIFIEMVLIILLGIVDTVMLSQCSDNTVAAVGVVVQLLNMIFLVFEATTAGTSVLCSQFLGARQMDNVFRTIGVSLAFNMMMGVIVSAALFFGAERILRLMELRPELMGDGVTYMRIVGGFAFFQAISLTLSAILRSAGMAYYPMQVTFLINIINIIGNYTLIFGHFGFPALGVEGAAISTSFSRGVAMCLLIFILFRKNLTFPPAFLWPFPFGVLRKMLSIGLPSGGEQLSYSLSQVVITYFVNMLGNEALAARTYAVNIVTFSYVFAMSVGQGGGICIGHLIGKGRKNAALLLGRYCIRITLRIFLFGGPAFRAPRKERHGAAQRQPRSRIPDSPDPLHRRRPRTWARRQHPVRELPPRYRRRRVPVHHRAYLHVGRGDRRRLRARRHARLRARRDVDRLHDG